MSKFEEWYQWALGRGIDVDGAFQDQCVDMAMSWAMFCFPGHNWPELIGLGNAKDLYGTANEAYFDRLKGITPQQGDLVIFGSTQTNPFGHIAVVISADSQTMAVIEQNGFNPSGVAYIAHRPYNNIIGYLRPKGEDMSLADVQNLQKQIDDLRIVIQDLTNKLNDANKRQDREDKPGGLEDQEFAQLDAINKRLDKLEGK